MKYILKLAFMIMNKYIYLLLLCVVSLGASAQEYVLSGKLIDSKSSEPIEMAGVRLMKSDSTYVDGTATSSSGAFSFNIKSPGKYILMYTSIGYYNKYTNQ